MKDPETRHRLLLATIDCIEKLGIEGCTIRAIAIATTLPLAASSNARHPALLRPRMPVEGIRRRW